MSIDDPTQVTLGGESADGKNRYRFLAPPQASDELGRLGSYRVLRLLGEGGMGYVFLAEDIALQRSIALKVMKPEIAAKPSARERFLREARAAAKIKHDHIITIYQVGEDRNVPFIALEFLEGMPLDAYLKERGEISLGQVIRIGKETAAGLQAAHSRGLIHRDIKPANIWLESRAEGGERKAEEKTADGPGSALRSPPSAFGRVKILDFGLARQEDDTHLTHSGAVVGTPAFMSPEQARAEEIDGRSDLFSLGVMLYRLGTGRLPFTGKTTMALLASLALDTPPAPVSLNPHIPPGLQAIIERLLDKDPAKRFQSAQEVVDALAALEGESSVAAVKEVVYIPVMMAPPAALPGETQSSVVPDVWEAIGSASSTSQAQFTQEDAIPEAANASVIAEPKQSQDAVPLAEPALPAKRSRLLLAVGLLAVVAASVTAFLLTRQDKNKDTGEPPPENNEQPKAEPKPGELLVLKAGNPAVEFRFRWIPAGSFQMGSEKVANEKPVHRVSISKGFWMAETETTQAQWKAVLSDASPGKGDNLPVTGMTWFDAKEFCDRMTRFTGKSIRLPTEAQWEYACRAGTTTDYSTGDGEEALKRAGWYDGNSGGRLQLGGQKEPNAWGLRDMHGNVWEWCLDDARTYTAAEQTDPLGALTGANRVIRGSAYNASPPGAGACRSAFRLSFSTASNGNVGFRVVCDVGTPSPEALRDPERAAAEYVLSVGGVVRVNDLERELRAATDLPQAPFRLTWVYLPKNKQVTDAALGVFKDCKNLVGLDLSETSVSDAGLAHFKNCKNLTQLSLHNTKLSDAGLVAFKDCKTLTHLSLHHTQLTTKGLVNFKDCSNLTELQLNQTSVNDAGLAYFKDCKNLALVQLDETLVGDAGLAHFKDCKNLRTLYLRNPRITNAGLAHLKELPLLTRLELRTTKITTLAVKQFSEAFPECRIDWSGGTIEARKSPDRVAAEYTVSIGGTVYLNDDLANNPIKLLSNLPTVPFRLTGVNLSGNKEVNDEGLANFKDCRNLLSLNLNNTRVTPAGCAHFKNCTKLTGLSLAYIPATDAVVANFKDCTNLTNLNLGYSQITDAGLAHLKDCKELKSLNLSHTFVTGSGLANFKNCTNLTNLDLGNATQITDAALEHIQGLTKISWIELEDTPISDAGLAHLKALTNLGQLGLERTQITGSGLVHLKGMSNLAYLWMDGSRLTDIGLEHIKSLPRLSDLKFPNTPVSDAGLKHLHVMSHLQYLTITRTRATPDGVKALSDALPECQITWDGGNVKTRKSPERIAAEYAISLGGSVRVNIPGYGDIKVVPNLPSQPFMLTGVNLNGLRTNVTDTALASFKDCKHLTMLNVSEANVTDAGLANFKGCDKLTSLDLHDTKVTDAGLVHFKECKELTQLIIWNTAITDAGLIHLQSCHKLTGLNLDKTQVSDTGLEILAGFTESKWILLHQTKVTAAGVKKLATALPKCKIEWDGGIIDPKK